MPPYVIDTPFGFALNLSFWQDLFAQPSSELVASLFAIIGWAVLVLIFFYMGNEFWLNLRANKYTRKWKWVVLAVDIPPMFIQSPKAVEQIFAHLTGAQIGPNVIEKYWMGRKQKYFSLEIISIEGYIQFLIRTEEEFRDLVEAAIYAQYPEAEITEVEDYVDNIPNLYPNEEYDIFGGEFGLEKEDAYPIRTYPNFEYSLSKDVVYSDPMAAILENFTRIGHGENFWMQIIVEPTGSSWKEKGISLVKNIIENKKPASKKGILGTSLSAPLGILGEASKILKWDFTPAEKKEEATGKVSDLTPGKKITVEAIEEKIAKVGFKTKMRVIYAARKEVFNPGRCFDGFVGAMNQFNIQSRNALVPYKITKLHYLFKEMRLGWMKTAFVSAIKKRKMKFWGNPYILNIEELATLWHFPLPFVKAPLVQKAGVKRAEPPIDLPVEMSEGPLKRKTPPSAPPSSEGQVPSPPEDLPYA